jgi:hypothetical protein
MRVTAGLPGSGLSASHLVSFSSGERAKKEEQRDEGESLGIWQPRAEPEGTTLIKSASISGLTSEGLRDTREMLCDVSRQRKEVQDKIVSTEKLLSSLKRERFWKSLLVLRWLFYKRLSVIDTQTDELEKERQELKEWLQVSRASIVFSMNESSDQSYQSLVAAFTRAAECAVVWDVTAQEKVDSKERSAAARAITRIPITRGLKQSPWVVSEHVALSLGNQNGHPLFIYPGFLLVDGGEEKGPALISFPDLRVDFRVTRFLEEEKLPKDAIVLGHTWAKVNKDGKKDKRFANNYQIPIAAYGELKLTSLTGLHEVFQFSDAVAGLGFALRLRAFQLSLREDGSLERFERDLSVDEDEHELLSKLPELINKEY